MNLVCLATPDERFKVYRTYKAVRRRREWHITGDQLSIRVEEWTFTPQGQGRWVLVGFTASTYKGTTTFVEVT
jgi:autotransporter-associated beta strand protein